MPEYDLNFVGDRFDKATLDQYFAFKQMKKNNTPMYQELIDRIKKLPASYGIAVNAMIRGDGEALAEELGDPSLAFFDASMISNLLGEIEAGHFKPTDPERSAREFNRPMNVLSRMGEIVSKLQTVNAGRDDAIKDAETKMKADIQTEKRRLRSAPSNIRNPIRRWWERRKDIKNMVTEKKANYAEFCRTQREEHKSYMTRIDQYQQIRDSAKLFQTEDWVRDVERFVNEYEARALIDTLAKTSLGEDSRYYEDAQAIKKQMDLSRQIRSEAQMRGSVEKGTAPNSITIKNPMKEIQEKDGL